MARARLDSPNKTEVWSVRLTRTQGNGVRALAREADRPFTSQIRHIVRQYLAQRTQHIEHSEASQ